jgi:hypothetical protein
MKLLESNYENQLYCILADYIYIKSKEEGFVGAFAFPYFDDCNVIELIEFYDQEPKKCKTGSIQIGDIIVNFVSFNKSMLPEFGELIQSEILYDTDDLLRNQQIEFRKHQTGFIASNQLQIGVRFRVRLANLIRQRIENDNINLFYASIVDYYYNLFLDDTDFEFNYEACKNNIKNGEVPFLSDKLDLHNECLEESLKGLQAKKDEENVKKYEL